MARIGIIGCGHWGRNYVRVFGDSVRAQLVAVSDLQLDRARQACGSRQGIRPYQDYREMLRGEKLDAVVVATTARSHAEIILNCLDSGLDVLAEKPLTCSIPEADTVVQRASERRKILMVAHTFLYNTAVRKMKSLVDEGRAGQIYYVKATRTHLGLVREDVNCVWDLAPHDVSILTFLLGQSPVRVQAMGTRVLGGGREDVAFVNLGYPKNIIATIVVSWVDAHKVRTIEVVGSKARIVFDDLNPLEPVRLFEKGISVDPEGNGFGEFKLAVRDGDIISPKIAPAEPLRTMCDHFLDCVADRREPLTSGSHGREVVRILVEIEKALKDAVS